MSDWNPQTYSRFSALRLRPAVDLLMRVPDFPGHDIVDLGCGNGAVGPVLRTRYPQAQITGLDNSPTMLEEAWKTGVYDALTQGDIAAWMPDKAPGLIYSNAALHWLPDYETLLPALVGKLAPGGTLAVQVPHQNNAPSHRTWHDLVDRLFPGRFDRAESPGILDAPATWDVLDSLGDLTLWETEYMQLLPASDEAHPVRQFTSSTFARPVFAVLSEAEQAELCAEYDKVMEAAYPRRADGSALFPFRRLFFTVTRAD